MFQNNFYWKQLFSRSLKILLLNLLIVSRCALAPALAQPKASSLQGQGPPATLQPKGETLSSNKRAALPRIQCFAGVFYSPEKEISRSLDLYLPNAGAKYKLPLVILIHGGGWQGGDKKDFAEVAQKFVERGFAAASINYRLSKEAIWPAQAIDCKQAVKWLRAHAEEFHLDPERFAVGGHSAGGHLSAFLAASNGVKKFDPETMLDVSSDVQAELWFAGVADLITRATTKGYESEQSPDSGESRLLRGPVIEKYEAAADASPVTWVSARSAPFYFEAGSDDKIVPPHQVDEMRLALKKFDVYSETRMLEGVGHGGGEFFDPDHLALMTNFLGRTLKLDDSLFCYPKINAAYTIRPFSAPDLVLSAEGKMVEPEPRIFIDNDKGRLDGRWTFSRRGNLFAIHPSNDTMVALTVLNGMRNNKSPVVLSRDLHKAEQTWRIEHSVLDNAYYLIPCHAPNCALDDFGGSKIPGSFVDIFQLNMNDEHEKWTLQLDEQVAKRPSVNRRDGITVSGAHSYPSFFADHKDYEWAFRRCEWIGICSYIGYEKRGQIDYFNPPTATFRTIKAFKALPSLQKDIKINFKFHDQVGAQMPEGWAFSEDKMPPLNSQWIIFIPIAIQSPEHEFYTYDGCYGRQPATEENVGKITAISETHHRQGLQQGPDFPGH